MKRRAFLFFAATPLILAQSLFAGGTLVPKGSVDRTVEIKDHRVEVILNNGFARTEVFQTFFNPNSQDLEAIYSFPVPKSASLSEMAILAGESEIRGEVVEKEKARAAYEEERDKGNDAGLAEKNSFYTYDFYVARVPAAGEISFRFVYFQPLEIDTGVGRYVYPLEPGGTDEAALSFWDNNPVVQGSFSFHLELKSAWPVEKVRMPGLEAAADIQKKSEGHYDVRIEAQGATLDKDLVLYYKLVENLPGRIEVIPYRSSADGPGTFLMVVTPGINLGPLSHGADYVFVLDTSGSMEGKIHTLVDGVCKVLGQMNDQDRFKLVEFNDRARELTPDFLAATHENVRATIELVSALDPNGSTNLFDGVQLALKNLDADRATSIVLVTDAVANQGEVAPEAFVKLMQKYDVRVFGFLLGNSANWPLMRTICEVSGGFYAGVSNCDDIVGQMLLAKGKITHECLHDAKLSIKGVKTWDVTNTEFGKVYRGQQLVMFGRYEGEGQATVQLSARLTGEDKVYAASFDFPKVDTDNPELERLWALDRIESMNTRIDRGLVKQKEGEQAIADLGVQYQLVTDFTSMLVLSDQRFDERGIARRNRERTALEDQARIVRSSRPAKNYRVDQQQPAFPSTAPSASRSSGGGALDGATLLLMVCLGALVLGARRTSTAKS